jgi:DNA (cytosine-5)-methyltransferase 1
MRVIDLFSGCGGKTLGFSNAGFKIVGAFDNWQACIDVYRDNFKDHKIYNSDLSKLKDLSIFKKLKPDIIIGGPPCQDFSSAGKRNEELGRADLSVSFAKLIVKLRPKYFVMENVDRIAKSKRIKTIYSILKKANYGLSSKVLDASLCGVPQKRKRFFLVGILDGADDIMNYYFEKNMSSIPMTVKDYLGNSLKIKNYYRHPRNYNRRAVFSINEPSATIRGVNRPIPKGYKGHPNDSSPIDKNVRALTTIERSYIQTFPKEFKFKGTKTDLELMIGNAVPVKMAEFVANALKEYIRDIKNGKVVDIRKNQMCLDFQQRQIVG